jgi:type I restriction enzyme S subunit
VKQSLAWGLHKRNGWERKPLAGVLDDIIDYRGRAPDKTESGVPLITARNVRKGSLDFSDAEEFIATEAYEQWMSRGIPTPGDVLAWECCPFSVTG